ncbi:choice-of-anchor H family protein [Colwellia sp. MB3u-70]|uniref:choice-of-anchor H family protein n=1 Tax=unclassified Colwellia TaxID=196834 RepID=UPI0015F49670|nr:MULTISPECIES: choice-of-anchor H family protein [unclassified Colwellia]MBA6290874.1 choice-of-anchor H family protein [Colwellia sp. MB3u-8]MBA6306437.1 choice-of-anchor H family protein [Colwellia sp. MB3u-70]
MFNKNFYQLFNKRLNKLFNQKFTIKLTATLLLVSQVSVAQTQLQVEQVSRSASGLKNNVVEREKTNLKSNLKPEEQIKISQRTLAFKGMSRPEVSYARQQKATSNLLTSTLSQDAEYDADSYHSFVIYSGYSELILDIDEDGYYQSFSVTFDADILSSMANEQAVVYADLYLSQNGGPWVLYFSSDDFVITGEDSEDEFEVVTQLDSGYVADHYDVLIDLYEVGFSAVMATYSASNTNALYALPLESSDYDPEYIAVEYYDEHSGGSSWLLFGALLALVYRYCLVKFGQY